MNVPPLASAPAAADALPRALTQHVEELARLLETPVPAGTFYARFLQQVSTALGCVAVAVWRPAQGEFHLEHHLHVDVIGLDQPTHAAACHVEILRRVVRRDRPVWVPAHHGPAHEGEVAPTNLTRYGVLLAPVLIDGEPAGIVEAWLEASCTAELREAGARFLSAAAGLLAAYVHKERFRQLQEQQLRTTERETLARQLHASLDPREVAYLLANQGRLLLGCDTVSVGVRRSQAVQVEAVSGATAVAQRSPLVVALRTLFESVLAWGEKVVFAGQRDESLPPPVVKALDEYLARSNCRALLVLPLRDERDQAEPGPGRAVVLIESFDPNVSITQLEGHAQVLAAPATAALYNALAYQRARANPIAKAWAVVQDWTRGNRGRVVGLVVAVVLTAIAALTLIPAPLRVEARGQLLPKERQTVYASRFGKVIDVKTYHGDQVHKGQELLYVEDLEAQLKVEQLAVKIAYAEQRLAALAEQLSKAASHDERNYLARERINQEYELRKAAVERDILLQESRSPRKSPIVAPLAGKMVTFDAREQLVGRTVKPGDPLVRVARVQGPWEIELNLGESALAPIREGLRRSSDGALEVNLLLASQPLRTFKGRLRWEGLGGETIVKENAVMLPVRVEIDDAELIEQLATLPVGLEVRARIHCGPRAVGIVWFGDLVEFLYERFLF